MAILSEHSAGVTAREIIGRRGISLDTYFRWKRQYSGMTKAEPQRLEGLEDENRHRKRMVADQAVNARVLMVAPGEEW